MGKIVLIATTIAAALLAGSLTWQVHAQTSRAAALLGHAAQNFTPIDKAPIEQTACRGWGRHCPPGRVWACGPRGCWCRWC